VRCAHHACSERAGWWGNSNAESKLSPWYGPDRNKVGPPALQQLRVWEVHVMAVQQGFCGASMQACPMHAECKHNLPICRLFASQLQSRRNDVCCAAARCAVTCLCPCLPATCLVLQFLGES